MVGPGKHTLRDLLSPGPSLETEDDEDEDFVVDEEEAEGTEGDDDEEEDEEGDEEASSGSGGEAGEETETQGAARSRAGGAADTGSVARSSGEEVRRRAQVAALVQQYGGQELNFEEEILSDSDISQHFPEEDEDELAEQLGAGLLDSDESISSEEEEEEEEETEEEEEAAGEAGPAAAAAQREQQQRVQREQHQEQHQEQQQQQEQQPHDRQADQEQAAAAAAAAPAAADAAAMPPPPPRPPRALASPPQHAAASAAVASTAAAAVAAVAAAADAALDPELQVFGVQLEALDDPIAHRTRAHHNLEAISIEELEQMLQVDDHLEGLAALDDEAEYQRFLAGLRGGDGTGAAFSSFLDDEEDEDDGDFYQDLRAMLGMPGDEAPGQPGGQAAGGERKLTKRARTRAAMAARRAKRLALKAGGMPAALAAQRRRPLAPKPFTSDLARIATALSAGATQLDPALVSFLVYRITPLAIEQAPPNWQLAAMGRFIPAHLPVLLPDPPAAAASGDGAAAPLGLAVEPNAFQPRQYGALYRLLHQHSQLLIQVYLMAQASPDPAHAATAQHAKQMAEQLHQFAQQQSLGRQAQGIAPYNPEALGCSDKLPPLLPQPEQRHGRRGRLRAEHQERKRLAEAQAVWQPWSAGLVFSVADVAPLRWLNHVVTGAEAPPRQRRPHGEPAAAGREGQQGQQHQHQHQHQQQPGAEGGAEQAAGGGQQAGTEQQPGADQQQQQQQQQAEAGGSGDTAAAAGEAGGAQPPASSEQQGGEGEGLDSSSDEDLQSALPRRRRRIRKPSVIGSLLVPHPLWKALPPPAAAAVADIQPLLEPVLVPRVPDHVATTQLLFTPAEDQLLAMGIQKYAYDWARIRAQLLPTKSEQQLFHRKKNRVAGNAPDNCVKDVVRTITQPLKPDEISLLHHLLAFYGRQPGKWEAICRDHLPHRQPVVLAQLWGQHTGTASSPSDGQQKGKKRRQGGAAAGAARAGGASAAAAASGAAAEGEDEEAEVQSRLAGSAPGDGSRGGSPRARRQAAAAAQAPMVRSLFLEPAAAAGLHGGGALQPLPPAELQAQLLLLAPAPAAAAAAGHQQVQPAAQQQAEAAAAAAAALAEAEIEEQERLLQAQWEGQMEAAGYYGGGDSGLGWEDDSRSQLPGGAGLGAPASQLPLRQRRADQDGSSGGAQVEAAEGEQLRQLPGGWAVPAGAAAAPAAGTRHGGKRLRSGTVLSPGGATSRGSGGGSHGRASKQPRRSLQQPVLVTWEADEVPDSEGEEEPQQSQQAAQRRQACTAAGPAAAAAAGAAGAAAAINRAGRHQAGAVDFDQEALSDSEDEAAAAAAAAAEPTASAAAGPAGAAVAPEQMAEAAAAPAVDPSTAAVNPVRRRTLRRQRAQPAQQEQQQQQQQQQERQAGPSPPKGRRGRTGRQQQEQLGPAAQQQEPSPPSPQQPAAAAAEEQQAAAGGRVATRASRRLAAAAALCACGTASAPTSPTQPPAVISPAGKQRGTKRRAAASAPTSPAEPPQEQQREQQQEQLQQPQPQPADPMPPEAVAAPAASKRRRGRVQPEPEQQQQQAAAQPPVFEQEELADSEGEQEAAAEPSRPTARPLPAALAAAASAAAALEPSPMVLATPQWQEQAPKVAAAVQQAGDVLQSGAELRVFHPSATAAAAERQAAGETGPAAAMGADAAAGEAAQAAAADAGAAAAAMQPWTAVEDKLLLRTMLLAGEALTPQQLADLAEQVGGAAAGRSVDAVGERCLHVMQRYQEIRRRKAAAASASSQGTAPAAAAAAQ